MPQSGDGWPTVDDDGAPGTGPTDELPVPSVEPAWPAAEQADARQDPAWPDPGEDQTDSESDGSGQPTVEAAQDEGRSQAWFGGSHDGEAGRSPSRAEPSERRGDEAEEPSGQDVTRRDLPRPEVPERSRDEEPPRRDQAGQETIREERPGRDRTSQIRGDWAGQDHDQPARGLFDDGPRRPEPPRQDQPGPFREQRPGPPREGRPSEQLRPDSPRQDQPPRDQQWHDRAGHRQVPPGEATIRVHTVPPRQDAWPPPERPRAAPWRVEPRAEPETEPEAGHETEPAAEPARRKRLLVTAVAVVAVLGIAAGVVFGVPGLSDRLGLTDAEPEIAIEPPAAPVEFTPGLRPPGADAPAPTAAGVQAALAGPASSPALGTLTGIVLDPATGEVLWQSDPDTPLTPASTTKLLTAAAALLSLDHTAQLTTKVVQGSEPGSVVIVGGGDPTLSSLKVGVESVYPGAAHLSELVDQVKASGTPVESVQVDLGRYTGDSSARGWLPVDIAAGYITPIVPAMLDGGRSDARAQNGTRTANPARALAEEFAARIGATVPANADQTAPQDAKVLGEVRSAPMVEQVDTILRTSDNVLAETVAREVARVAGKEVSFEGASEATLEVLRTNGFDLTGVELADNSGLSTENRVPAKVLGEILKVAAAPDGDDPRTAKLRPLLGGLPVAGGSGTLDDRYGTPEAKAGKGYVRAKTGTLSGVNSLAGVVLDKDGRVLVFALMTGDTDSSARPALDTIAATLRGCGCG